MKKNDESILNRPSAAIVIALLACAAFLAIALSLNRATNDDAKDPTAYELYHAAVTSLENATAYSIESLRESVSEQAGADYYKSKASAFNLTVIRPRIGETKMYYCHTADDIGGEQYKVTVYYENGRYYRDDPSGKTVFAADEYMDKPIDEYVLSLHRQSILNFPEAVVLESSMAESGGARTLTFTIRGDTIYMLASGLVDEGDFSEHYYPAPNGFAVQDDAVVTAVVDAEGNLVQTMFAGSSSSGGIGFVTSEACAVSLDGVEIDFPDDLQSYTAYADILAGASTLR